MANKKWSIILSTCLIILVFTVCQGCASPAGVTPTQKPTIKPQQLSNAVATYSSGSSSQILENEETELNSTNFPMHDNMNSILWVQTSPEYAIAVNQSYSLAKIMLEKGLADPGWTAAVEQVGSNYRDLPPAIIVDVDETILNNSAFQARLEIAGASWDNDIWNNWVLESNAPAVPGAVEFLVNASDSGVTIFYVTNRTHDYEQATRENLISVGCPFETAFDTLLTQGEQEGWTSDKTTRRNFIAERYRIVLLIGDDPNDFIAGTTEGNSVTRNMVLSEYGSFFGEKWILIPNTIYGHWEGALYGFDYNLSEEERLDLKFDLMETQ